jgi:hypothetical protein
MTLSKKLATRLQASIRQESLRAHFIPSTHQTCKRTDLSYVDTIFAINANKQIAYQYIEYSPEKSASPSMMGRHIGFHHTPCCGMEITITVSAIPIRTEGSSPSAWIA